MITSPTLPNWGEAPITAILSGENIFFRSLSTVIFYKFNMELFR